MSYGIMIVSTEYQQVCADLDRVKAYECRVHTSILHKTYNPAAMDLPSWTLTFQARANKDKLDYCSRHCLKCTCVRVYIHTVHAGTPHPHQHTQTHTCKCTAYEDTRAYLFTRMTSPFKTKQPHNQYTLFIRRCPPRW